MANYNHGGGASGDPTETLLAQLRRQSSPSPGPGAGQESMPHFGYNHSQGGQQSFYSHHSNTDSPNPGGHFQDGMDSPGFFPPVAPTPPVNFGHSQYPPGMMNPIGTGRGAAPAGDERTARLLNLLKFDNGPSGSSNPQPTSRDPPMNYSNPPAPTIIHAPAPASADPTGLLAALMNGTLQSEQPKPEPPAPSTWNQAAPPSATTQQYLLDLLHRPKPSQNDADEPQEQNLLTPPPGDDDARDLDDMHRSAEPTLVDAMPSQSDFEYDREPMESPHPKFDSTPHSQHSHATSNQYGMHGGHGNPFDDLSGISPVHRTPTSTTPGASASGHAAAAPIRILKKPESAHSDQEQTRPLADRGVVPSPEHAKRKFEHAASPLSQASAPRSIHQNMSPQSDRSHHRAYNTGEAANGEKKESVAQAVSGIAEQADREAREALARVQEEQAQAEIDQNMQNMMNARTGHEFNKTAQIAAIAIQKQLDREPNNAVLDSTLSPDIAKEVKDIIEEAAHGTQGIADSWESADADEIVVEEREAPVKVYNFPMKPWIAISLLESNLPRPTFRDDSVLDIARLKKDFDQVDRNLASGSETYMAYGMSKAGGLRVIRQEDGKDAKLFTDTKDRIFNVAISSSPPGEHRKEAIIGTGVSGTVYWVQLKNGDRDHLGDTHPEQYGFALPPISTQEGDAPGGILKTRARASSVHPEFFAVGRGKSINIIWPSFILEHNLFKQGHDRVVDTERLMKQCSLKINTGKAGKDFTFSQDDSVVVSLDKSGRVKFWDVRDLVAIKEGSDPSVPMPVHTSLEIKEPLMTLTSTPEGEKAWPTSVLLLDKFRPYQKRVALRYMIVGMKQNHTLQLWDLALGKPVQEFNFPHNKESDAVCSVMYHAPSSMIVVGHPTRNSIYFLHLSAPKYSLKNLSQVEYIQRLVAQDPSIPMPDSTAVISGIREYSWAKKGVLRSLSIVENASSSSSESEEPTLFELYAMHSKGVTCINVKQGELGWTKDNKVISSADAVDAGMAKITKLPAPVAQPSSEAQQPATPADGHATPQIRIAARGGRDSSQKTAAASEDKKGQDMSTPKLERKEEVETPVPQTERSEKKGRKKRNAADRAAAAAADRDLPSLSGPGDLSRTLMSPNKSSGRRAPAAESTALALTNQFNDLTLAPPAVSQDHLDSLVANMESRLVSTVSGRFDSVFSDVMKQMQAFQDNRDSAFVTNQSALLQMVSDVLNNNVESVMKNQIEEQINGSVIPALRSAVDKSVSDQLTARTGAQTSSLQKEIQRLLPSAVGQSMQKPDVVKTISDKISHNVNYYIDSQITKSLEAIVPDIATITAKTVHQRVVEDVGAQLSDAIARMEDRMEDRRRVEDEKLDRLVGQTMDLSSAISSLAASQAQFQNDLAELKQQLKQDREREPVAQELGLAQGRSRDSVGSHGKAVPAPRDMVTYQPQHQPQHQQQHQPHHQQQHQSHAPQHVAQQHHAQPHHFPEQVVFAPASRESRERLELNDAKERIDNLMRSNNTDEAILAWLHDTNKTEEIFQQVLSKFSPTCITELQPLVLLSVGATISSNFSRASEKIVDKVNWLEVAVLAFDRMVPNLDAQVRGVTPKIMTLVKERAENLLVDISRVAPHDPTLKTLSSIARHADRIANTVQSRHSGPFDHAGPASGPFNNAGPY